MVDPSLFTHEAHLRLAWVHITKIGVEKAILNICQDIERFDKKHGDGTKFNKDLTVASVKIIHQFTKRSNAKTFKAFLIEYPNLKCSFKEMLNLY